MPTLAERCAAIQMLVLDVDGVLTDGRIVYVDGDMEIKAFHVRDGSGIKLWREAGKSVAIITGRDSPCVSRRAAELGIDVLRQGVKDKLAAFREILAGAGLRADEAAAVGDDLPDVPVLRAAGLAVAVADACPEARGAAHYVPLAAGGQAAVRETIECILRCQGTWQRVAGN